MNETWEYGADPVQAPEPFPWPPAEDGAILAAFGATWKATTFDPAATFRRVPRSGGIGAALVYYLAVGILLAGATLFWQSVSYSEPIPGGPLAELGILADPLVQFLLAPVTLLLSLFASAGIVHVLLLIFDGATHGFGTTLRVFCYAYSPALFAAVPYVGGPIGLIWLLVLSIIGLREAHEAAAWKPAVAVLVPLFAVLFLIVLAVMMLVAAGLVG